MKPMPGSIKSPTDKQSPRTNTSFHLETPLRSGPVCTDSKINTEPLIHSQHSRPNSSDSPRMETFADQQSPSISNIDTMPPPHGNHDHATINPVLLRYQQWKKAHEITVNSGTAVTTTQPSTGVATNSVTPELISDNPGTQLGSVPSDSTSQMQRSTDIIVSRAHETPEPDLLPGDQVESHLTSPSEQSPLFKLDMLTPLMKSHARPDFTLITDHVRDVDDALSSVTKPCDKATRMTYTKGFTTPMMSSVQSHFYEFGQTPLENIAPPLDFNSNSLYHERIESVRSRLSFDLATPGSSMRTTRASGAQHYLNTPSAKDIADVKLDDVVTHREFDLIPVNTDDLFQDDCQLTFGENIREFKDKGVFYFKLLVLLYVREIFVVQVGSMW